MLLLPKLNKALPASLIAVLLATVAAELLQLDIPRIGALPQSLSAPSMPALDPAALGGLLMPAVSIAMLAAIESLLSARVAAGLVGPDGRPSGAYSPDRELTGQGLASIAAGFFGGMPATGAIARTAVNVRSGARTRLSAIVHALVLLAIIYFAAGLVGKIPLAVLAGILMVTATPHGLPAHGDRHHALHPRRRLRVRPDSPHHRGLRPDRGHRDRACRRGPLHAAEVRLAQRGQARGDPGTARGPGDEHIAIFRLDGAMFFGAAERVLQEISQVKDIQVAIIRLSQVRMLDATGAHTLVEVISALELRGVTVLLKGVQPQHLELVTNVGVIRSLRHHKHLFTSLPEAVEHARSHVRRNAAASV